MITRFSGIIFPLPLEGGVGWLISLNLLAREKEDDNKIFYYCRTVQIQFYAGLAEKTADWLKQKG